MEDFPKTSFLSKENYWVDLSSANTLIQSMTYGSAFKVVNCDLVD